MNKSLLFFTVCLSTLLFSCNKTEVEDSVYGVGVLSVDMTIDAPETKAALTNDELIKAAKVNIYRDKKGLVRSYTMSSMPSPIYLEAGNFSYRVDVEAGEVAKAVPAKASWEQKSYKGSELFTITANQVTNIKVDATVCNAVTKISFDPTVAENFEQGYTFTIGLDSEDPATQLVYDVDNSGAEGYFIIDGIKNPSFTWNFSGTLTKDGKQFTKSGTISGLNPGRLYKMNLVYTVKDGDLGFTLFEDDSYSDVFNERIEFDPVTTGLVKSRVKEFWATKATLYALVDQSENEGKSVQFAYRSGDDGDWVTVDGEYVDNSEYNYTVRVTGLSPATEYTYKLIVGGVDAGDNLMFTTEDAPNLPNAGFEHYSEVAGHSGVYKFFNPSCTCSETDAHKKFWASGNGDEESQGSIFPADFAVITDISKEYKKEGECSVVAQSRKPSLADVLAAGNLFTGQFVSATLEGSSQSGIVNFGRKWTTRPSALKIWFRYETGNITHVSSNPEGLTKNDYDRAQIKVAIGTWKNGSRANGGYGGSPESPVQVLTSDPSTFVDFYTDNSTIANGDVIIYNDGYLINGPLQGSQKVGGINTAVADGLEITIPLNYHEGKLETSPSHIIISCAASQYGDYFTGCSSSKLWLDAFELIYE